jgi:hypothetical protein
MWRKHIQEYFIQHIIHTFHSSATLPHRPYPLAWFIPFSLLQSTMGGASPPFTACPARLLRHRSSVGRCAPTLQMSERACGERHGRATWSSFAAPLRRGSSRAAPPQVAACGSRGGTRAQSSWHTTARGSHGGAREEVATTPAPRGSLGGARLRLRCRAAVVRAGDGGRRARTQQSALLPSATPLLATIPVATATCNSGNVR